MRDHVMLTPTSLPAAPELQDPETSNLVYLACAYGAADLAVQLNADETMTDQHRSAIIHGMAVLVGHHRLRFERFGSGLIQASLNDLANTGIEAMNMVIASHGTQMPSEPVEEEAADVPQG